ncbi:MAG: glycosyltransferase family 2 protein [Candidatus Hydrogenedentes bacterium]|nr:glycosyltransferase family 2 protein [Candidatus Hydrogenedentota bacterium]
MTASPEKTQGGAKSVSIFYPCYQDWGTMGSMVLFTVQTAERLGLDYDITIVDDGSAEHTRQLLQRIEKDYPKVSVLYHPKNRGYGGALRSGFAAATREWIFYTDGDAQYDVRELELLLERAGPDVDVVQGYKITRSDPLHRKIIGRIYHYIVKTAFGLKLRDVDCDFRLIRRSVFDTVHLESDSGVICAEMMMKIQRGGFRVVEVPVHHFQRAHGKSQFFNFTRIARVVWQLGGLWVRYVLLHALLPGNKHHDPLRGPEKTVSGPRVRDAGGH